MGHGNHEPPRRIDATDFDRCGDVVDRCLEHRREAQPRYRIGSVTCSSFAERSKEPIGLRELGSDLTSIRVGHQHVRVREQNRIAALERPDFADQIGEGFEVKINARDPDKLSTHLDRTDE